MDETQKGPDQERAESAFAVGGSARSPGADNAANRRVPIDGANKKSPSEFAAIPRFDDLVPIRGATRFARPNDLHGIDQIAKALRGDSPFTVAYGRENAAEVVLDLAFVTTTGSVLHRSGVDAGGNDRVTSAEALMDLLRSEQRIDAPRLLVHVVERSSFAPYDVALLGARDEVENLLRDRNMRLVLVVEHQPSQRLDDLAGRQLPNVVRVPWMSPYLEALDQAGQIIDGDRQALFAEFDRRVAGNPSVEPVLVRATRKFFEEAPSGDCLPPEASLISEAKRAWDKALRGSAPVPDAVVSAFREGHAPKMYMVILVAMAPERRVTVAALDDLVIDLLGEAPVPREHIPADVMLAREAAEKDKRDYPEHARIPTWSEWHRDKADVWRADLGLRVDRNHVVPGLDWDAERAPTWVRTNSKNAWRRVIERILDIGIVSSNMWAREESAPRASTERPVRAGLLALDMLLAYHADVAADEPWNLARITDAMLGYRPDGSEARKGLPNRPVLREFLSVVLEAIGRDADASQRARRSRELLDGVYRRLVSIVNDDAPELAAGILVGVDRDADGGVPGVAEFLRTLLVQATDAARDRILDGMLGAAMSGTPEDRVRTMAMFRAIASAGAADSRVLKATKRLDEELLQNDIRRFLYRRPDAARTSLGTVLFNTGAPERDALIRAMAELDGLIWHDPSEILDRLRVAIRMADVFFVCIGGFEAPIGVPLDALPSPMGDAMHGALQEAFFEWFLEGIHPSLRAVAFEVEAETNTTLARDMALAVEARRMGREHDWTATPLDERQRSFLDILDRLRRRFLAALMLEFRFAVFADRSGDPAKQPPGEGLGDADAERFWSALDRLRDLGGKATMDALRLGAKELAEFVGTHARGIAANHHAVLAERHYARRARIILALAESV